MAQVNDDYPKKSNPADEMAKAAAIAQYESQKETKQEVHDFPTEIIELPSKGLLYPDGHPLSNGKLEMKYMTAKEEDILTNQSFIKQGVVLDKLFKSLIVTKVPYDDLFVGDKNAIMVAARVLGYGKLYDAKVTTPSGNEQDISIDLTDLKEKEIDWDVIKKGETEYDYELPASKRKVKVQLVNGHIQKKIDAENKGLQKLGKDASATTLLKHIITEVDGDRETGTIRKFVDNMLAIDARGVRNFLKELTPDMDLSVYVVDEATLEPFRTSFAIGLDFFWPDAEL